MGQLQERMDRAQRAYDQVINCHELRRNLGRWLSEFEWSCWCTWTFDARFGDTGPSPDRCLHHTRRWIEQLPGPSVGYFVATESGRLGRVHSHGLLRLPDGTTPARKSLWRSWFTRYGRCRVLPYNPRLGATHYVAKYITKEPLGWDLGGTWTPVDVSPVQRDASVVNRPPTPPP